jgi:hypothetical protein
MFNSGYARVIRSRLNKIQQFVSQELIEKGYVSVSEFHYVTENHNGRRWAGWAL